MLHQTVFELGSLEVFTKFGQPGYYWLNKNQVWGRGPFPSIYAALGDFRQLRKSRGGSASPPTPPPPPPLYAVPTINTQIIQVDFKNKQRIA